MKDITFIVSHKFFLLIVSKFILILLIFWASLISFSSHAGAQEPISEEAFTSIPDVSLDQLPKYKDGEMLVRLKEGVDPIYLERLQPIKIKPKKPKSFIEKIIDFFRQILGGKTEESSLSDTGAKLKVIGVEKVISTKVESRTLKLRAYYPKEERLDLGGLARLYLVKFNGASVEEAVAIAEQSPQVERAHPNFLYYLSQDSSLARVIPNDPLFKDLWGLEKIHLPEAWALGRERQEVIVSVIDSGVSYSHPDLAERLWINSKEIPNNWEDDDNNGYVDDYYGYTAWLGYKPCKDYFSVTPQPDCNISLDVIPCYTLSNDPNCNIAHWHGTHVGGTIAAIRDNREGITGISNRVKIMSNQVVSSYVPILDIPLLSENHIIKAIIYSVDNGAKVINMSLEGLSFSDDLKAAIDLAVSNDIVVVAAAGNDGQESLSYPARYEKVIAVAAIAPDGSHAEFSNSGDISVAAPGVDILSTFPPWLSLLTPQIYPGYRSASGTSMAAPHAAGLAAFIRSVNPQLTNIEVRQIIEETADDLGEPGWDPDYGYGLINAYNAIAKAMGIVSSTPTLTPTVTLSVPPLPIEVTPTPGKLPNLSSCGKDEECASGFCDRSEGVPGICRPSPTPPPNECERQGGVCIPTGLCRVEGGIMDRTKGCSNNQVCCKGIVSISTLTPTSIPELGELSIEVRPQEGRSRGEGGTYYIGEEIAVCWTLPQSGNVKVTKKIDEREEILFEDYDEQAGGCLTGVVAPPSGERKYLLYYESEEPVSTSIFVVSGEVPSEPSLPTETPAAVVPPTVTPTATVIPTPTGVPNGWQCGFDYECASKFCDLSGGIPGVCRTPPTFTPSPTPTKTPCEEQPQNICMDKDICLRLPEGKIVGKQGCPGTKICCQIQGQ